MENYSIYADYHTHTVYSDGVNTIAENVEQAILRGLKEIAISDHGMGHKHHGIKRELLLEIREEIDGLNERYKGIIKVFLGVEANIISLDGDIDVTDEDREYFDIVMMGFHRYVKYNKDGSYKHFMISSNFKKKDPYVIEKTTDAFIKAIHKNKIDIITHPGDPRPVNIERLATECVRTGTSLEINCKHMNLDVITIEELAKKGTTFVVGTDAHKKEDVGNFERAYRLLDEANIPMTSVLNAEWK